MHRMSLTSLAWLMRILAVTKVRIHVSDSRRYTIAGVSVLNRLRNPISTRLDLLYATRVSLHPRRNISMPVRWLHKSINTCTHVSLVEKARTRAMGVKKKKEKKDITVNRSRDRESRNLWADFFDRGSNSGNIPERVALRERIDCVKCEDKYINHAQF